MLPECIVQLIAETTVGRCETEGCCGHVPQNIYSVYIYISHEKCSVISVHLSHQTKTACRQDRADVCSG